MREPRHEITRCIFFFVEVREGVDDANVISCAEEMCHDYRLYYLV